MLNRIIRIIGTAMTGALLLAGCSVKLHDPDRKPDGSIGFRAAYSLLIDDAPTTKSVTLKETFDQASETVGAANADRFYVYGAKTVSNNRQNVFTGQTVTLTDLGSDLGDPEDDVWEYSPLRFWDSNASQYDFLALSGPASAEGITSNPAGSARVRASLTYDPTVAQYDLLAAGAQRNNGAITPVPMSFYHVLSAVRVEIINDSPLIEVQINSYGFRNICTRATGTIEQSGNGLATLSTSDWSNPAYNGSIVLGKSGASTLQKGDRYSLAAGQWDIMIPQSLEPYGDYTPQLILDYQYEGDTETIHPVFPIRLDGITVKNSESLITSWEPGKRYNYEIHIRLGGGVFVTVDVTDWTEIPAETPGLTI